MENPPATNEPNKTAETSKLLWISSALDKLSEAAQCKPTTAQLAIYLDRLSKISGPPADLDAAVDAVIETWDKPGMLPPLALLLDAHTRERQFRIAKVMAAGATRQTVHPDWDSKAQRARYARAYINAPQEIRERMKLLSTTEAIAYADSQGVSQGPVGTGDRTMDALARRIGGLRS